MWDCPDGWEAVADGYGVKGIQNVFGEVDQLVVQLNPQAGHEVLSRVVPLMHYLYGHVPRVQPHYERNRFCTIP